MSEIPRKLRESHETPGGHGEVGADKSTQEVSKKSITEILSKAKTRSKEGDEKSVDASRALQRIKNEGITHETLPLLAEHIHAFNLETFDLLSISDLVGHLLLEWDPTYHAFIRRVQADLAAAANK